MKIALLGSSGHVANNIYRLLRDDNEIYEFSREPIEDPMPENSIHAHKYFRYPYDHLEHFEYDAIINCVGFGNPAKVEKAGFEIFDVTDGYDYQCLQYLKNVNPKTKYIYFSSGAVYNPIDVNRMTPQTFYQISKLTAEARHRSLPEFNIIDIRLFSFFSRYANLDDSFFLNKIVKCVKEDSIFLTDHKPMVRDYIHPKDLAMLIRKIMKVGYPINRTFDTYSLRRIDKQQILNYFEKEHNLDVEYLKNYKGFSTANKADYYSTDYDGEDIHFCPMYESIDTIKEETEAILNEQT